LCRLSGVVQISPAPSGVGQTTNYDGLSYLNVTVDSTPNFR
jgi:hypothetical protein